MTFKRTPHRAYPDSAISLQLVGRWLSLLGEAVALDTVHFVVTALERHEAVVRAVLGDLAVLHDYRERYASIWHIQMIRCALRTVAMRCET